MASTQKRKRQPERVPVEADPAYPVDPPDSSKLRKAPDEKVLLEENRTLFVRGLPASTTKESLIARFSQSALLKHATVVLDPTTRWCKGYGFVTFTDATDARNAVYEYNDSLFESKKIKVEFAQRRHREVVDEPKLERQEQRSENTLLGGGADNQRKKSLHAQQSSTGAPRLIVRNLPWSMKEPQQLAHLFQSFGKVKDAKLPRQIDGTLRGFGFVLLRGRRNAEKAITAMNGREVNGRTLAVDWAAPKDVWEKRQAEQDKARSEEEQEASISVNSYNPDYPKARSTISDQELSEESTLNSLTSETISHEANGSLHHDSTISVGDMEEDDNKLTVFIRNLPYDLDDTALYAHFKRFGPLKYARVVLDYDAGGEGRSRGTGFVCFHQLEDAQHCLREAPQNRATPVKPSKDGLAARNSLLQNVQADASGRYTISGRLLQVTRCVDKEKAQVLAAKGAENRSREDRRHLCLLQEGVIGPSSQLYSKISPSETKLRDGSLKQRQGLVKRNPALHISLTRLAVRNIPKLLTSKDLKLLARQAVVGFAEDVKTGKRQPLNREEIARGGDDMRRAERERRLKKRGVVRQAKIVFESREGGKVAENSGAGRSRGYGFIEYSSHRWALMALRWLNGHLVKELDRDTDPSVRPTDARKRLIVEFAIENAQVVRRRQENERRSKHSAPGSWRMEGLQEKKDLRSKVALSQPNNVPSRKRDWDIADYGEDEQQSSREQTDKRFKTSIRQRIIGRKRAKRRFRKGITR